MDHDPPSVEVLWIPLGAGPGAGVVRRSGRFYEALAARRERRAPCALYHAGLEVRLDGERTVVEMAPEWSGSPGPEHVACSGPVGVRALGRSRWFRYEVRCWPGGAIPDADEAVAVDRLDTDAGRVARLLALTASAPRVTWGRDELATGEMWNSNSLVAWLLARSGHDTSSLRPPPGGRAPGWDAGLVVAERWGPPTSG